MSTRFPRHPDLQCCFPGLPGWLRFIARDLRTLRRELAAKALCAGNDSEHHLAEIPPCSPETSPCPVLQLPKLCASPAVVACSGSRSLTCLKQFLPSVNTEAERLFRAVQHGSVPRGWDSSLRRRDAHGGGIVPQQIMVKVAEGFVGHLCRSGVTAP